jgi:hypothetical protein
MVAQLVLSTRVQEKGKALATIRFVRKPFEAFLKYIFDIYFTQIPIKYACMYVHKVTKSIAMETFQSTFKYHGGDSNLQTSVPNYTAPCHHILYECFCDQATCPNTYQDQPVCPNRFGQRLTSFVCAVSLNQFFCIFCG